MKILHITDGCYYALAPLGTDNWILDQDNNHWAGTINDISNEEWDRLWNNNRILYIYHDRNININEKVNTNKNEFELID